MHRLLLLTLTISLSALADKNQCGECDGSKCAPLDFCVSGLTRDACNCCIICAKRLGDTCSINSEIGQEECGEFLTCVTQKESKVSKCECADEGAICGTDGVTYENLCLFLEAAGNNTDLTVKDRAPCKEGPIIRSPPKEAERPLGSILLLDCEAHGYPVPTITWELNKRDGSTQQLPNDDPAVAIQVRGGPEKHMATGWIQIMKITPDNVGLYTCIATNKEGQARASAKVTHTADKKTLMNKEDWHTGLPVDNELLRPLTDY